MADLGRVLSEATDYGDAREAEGRAAAEVEAAERIAELNAALLAEREEVARLAADMLTAMLQYDELRTEYDAHMATHEPDPDPDPDPPAVKIGASFKAGENLPASVRSIDVHRYFFQPGDFTRAQSWAGQPNLVKAHDQYGCRTFSISLKPDSNSGTAFGNPDRIRAFLDTIPEDVKPEDVLLTFYHEHDGNLRDGSLTIGRYRQGSEQLAAIAHERGHLFGPIHNANVYQAATPHWGLWPAVWAQNEADSALYDFMGFDCYSPDYQDPEPRMDAMRTYADALGLPLLIGELGAPAGDSARQAAWCKAARAWALKNTRWAMYWSSQIDGRENWRLSDAAAREWFGTTDQ